MPRVDFINPQLLSSSTQTVRTIQTNDPNNTTPQTPHGPLNSLSPWTSLDASNVFLTVKNPEKSDVDFTSLQQRLSANSSNGARKFSGPPYGETIQPLFGGLLSEDGNRQSDIEQVTKEVKASDHWAAIEDTASQKQPPKNLATSLKQPTAESSKGGPSDLKKTENDARSPLPREQLSQDKQFIVQLKYSNNKHHLKTQRPSLAGRDELTYTPYPNQPKHTSSELWQKIMRASQAVQKFIQKEGKQPTPTERMQILKGKEINLIDNTYRTYLNNKGEFHARLFGNQ